MYTNTRTVRVTFTLLGELENPAARTLAASIVSGQNRDRTGGFTAFLVTCREDHDETVATVIIPDWGMEWYERDNPVVEGHGSVTHVRYAVAETVYMVTAEGREVEISLIKSGDDADKNRPEDGWLYTIKDMSHEDYPTITDPETRKFFLEPLGALVE